MPNKNPLWENLTANIKSSDETREKLVMANNIIENYLKNNNSLADAKLVNEFIIKFNNEINLYEDRIEYTVVRDEKGNIFAVGDDKPVKIFAPKNELEDSFKGLVSSFFPPKVDTELENEARKIAESDKIISPDEQKILDLIKTTKENKVAINKKTLSDFINIAVSDGEFNKSEKDMINLLVKESNTIGFSEIQSMGRVLVYDKNEPTTTSYEDRHGLDHDSADQPNLSDRYREKSDAIEISYPPVSSSVKNNKPKQR